MVAVAVAAALWLGLLLAPWRPWWTSERLEADPEGVGSVDLSKVTVLMPARNEEAVIGETLKALASQGHSLRVIVIDDNSDDATVQQAVRSGLPGLSIITAPPLPPDWTGKLWALEQGRVQALTPYILLLDADIALAPGLIPALLHKAQHEDLRLVSLMAAPAMVGFWDRWLMPVFVYFFKLLYPFRLANRPGRRWGAAAGGCLLVRREALINIGGFAVLRDAVIDDCTLAALIKRQAGGGIWVGLTHSAVMMRANSLRSFWRMVARTAFTQLRYSFLLLALCAVVMGLVFLAPLGGLLFGGVVVRWVALLALVFMAVGYMPTARFYRQSPVAVLGLPAAGVVFLLMTFTSALWYARGVRSQWKGRSYRRDTT